MWMLLSPGEVFEHAHSDRSITMLLDGKVEMEVAGETTPLELGKPTPIDAHLPHRLINVGPGIALLKCSHIVVDPPTPV